MNKTTTGKRLQELANLNGLNQTEMRERLGFSKSTFSNYWNDKREPKQNVLTYIAGKFNVSEAWLMGYEVPMQEKPDYSDDSAHLVSVIRNSIDVRELITTYNQLDTANKMLVLDFAKMLLSKTSN